LPQTNHVRTLGGVGAKTSYRTSTPPGPLTGLKAGCASWPHLYVRHLALMRLELDQPGEALAELDELGGGLHMREVLE